VIQTIPSLALFAFLIALVGHHRRVPALIASSSSAAAHRAQHRTPA